jgi:hypothetical protein
MCKNLCYLGMYGDFRRALYEDTINSENGYLSISEHTGDVQGITA